MKPLLALASIGIGFNLSPEQERVTGVRFERLIAFGMPEAVSSMKSICLLYTWLTKYSHLLEAGALNEACRELPALEILVLAGLLQKSGAKNFGDMLISARQREVPTIPRVLNRQALAGWWPFDNDLKDFGLEINRVELMEDRKLRPAEWVAQAFEKSIQKG